MLHATKRAKHPRQGRRAQVDPPRARAERPEEFALAAFEEGASITVGDSVKGSELLENCAKIPGLIEVCRKSVTTAGDDAVASALEWVLEGLHLSGKIDKLNNIYS